MIVLKPWSSLVTEALGRHSRESENSQVDFIEPVSKQMVDIVPREAMISTL